MWEGGKLTIIDDGFTQLKDDFIFLVKLLIVGAPWLEVDFDVTKPSENQFESIFITISMFEGIYGTFVNFID